MSGVCYKPIPSVSWLSLLFYILYCLFFLFDIVGEPQVFSVKVYLYSYTIVELLFAHLLLALLISILFKPALFINKTVSLHFRNHENASFRDKKKSRIFRERAQLDPSHSHLGRGYSLFQLHDLSMSPPRIVSCAYGAQFPQPALSRSATSYIDFFQIVSSQ